MLALFGHLAVCMLCVWKLKPRPPPASIPSSSTALQKQSSVLPPYKNKGTQKPKIAIIVLLLMASFLKAAFWVVDLQSDPGSNGAFALTRANVWYNLPTVLSFVAWVFVLILWQQMLVVRGLDLSQTVRVCFMCVAPYTLFTLVFLLLSNDSALFLVLFYASEALFVLCAGIATVHTSRTLTTFLKRVKGDLSITLIKINRFLLKTSVISLTLFVYILALLLYGEQRKPGCGDVAYWSIAEVYQTVGAILLLLTFSESKKKVGRPSQTKFTEFKDANCDGSFEGISDLSFLPSLPTPWRKPKKAYGDLQLDTRADTDAATDNPMNTL
jgi:hypothetical protein